MGQTEKATYKAVMSQALEYASHTYIVSRHLATRVNNKILRTPLAALNRHLSFFLSLYNIGMLQ